MSSERPEPGEQSGFTNNTDFLNDITPEHKELETTDWNSLIILQRHSSYDNGMPANFDAVTDEEKGRLGHLTAEGREVAATRARERIDKIFESGGENVDFMVIASPTHWMGNEDLGQRADETGKVISETILSELSAKNADSARLLNTSDRLHGDLTRNHEGIEEARFFYSREFTDFMRKTYGGQGREFWDAINSDAHKELREELGAEGPQEVADRVQKTIELVARFSSYYESRHPGRKLATFIVSHSEDLEPYSQYKLGVAPEDFQPKYNDAIEIAINNDGQAVADVNGQEYPATVTK